LNDEESSAGSHLLVRQSDQKRTYVVVVNSGSKANVMQIEKVMMNVIGNGNVIFLFFYFLFDSSFGW
jgi:tetrahydromethanopterin S-methyltransferase subunit A